MVGSFVCSAIIDRSNLINREAADALEVCDPIQLKALARGGRARIVVLSRAARPTELGSASLWILLSPLRSARAIPTGPTDVAAEPADA